jgi:hypothetical protein
MNVILTVTKKLINVGISLYIGNLIGKDLSVKVDKAKVIIDAKIAKRREGTVQ